MEYRHTPVLLAEVSQQLNLHDGSIIVDCTLGGAGHSRRIQELIAPSGVLVGIDQDQAALDAATDAVRLGQQVRLVKGNFGELDRVLADAGLAYADGFLFDLASRLARDLYDIDMLSAFFKVIQQDPVLSLV